MKAVWIKGVSIGFICLCAAAGLCMVAITDYKHITPNPAAESKNDNLNKELPTNQLSSQKNPKKINSLFGQIRTLPDKPVQREIPETRLDLVLKGTFTHEDTAMASALIAESNKSTIRYFVGEEIPGEAKLVAVGKGEITIRRNGQDELLKLPFFQIDERLTRRANRNRPQQKTKAQSASNQQTSSQDNSPQRIKDRLAKLRSKLSNKTHIHNKTNTN